MFGITHIHFYIASVIVVILLPGPNSLFCLTTAAKQGVKHGYYVVAAILLGDTILMATSALGAGAILKSHPSLFFILKCLGAGYLSYLGLNMLIGGYQQFKKSSLIQENSAAENNVYVANPFSKGLMLSLTNPKAILFFLSFFIAFVDPKYPSPALTFFALGLILQVVSFSYLTVLVFLGTHLTEWFGSRKVLSALATCCVGLLFIGFSLKLLTAAI